MSNWDLNASLRVVAKWWWLLAISVALAAAAGYVGTRLMTPTYRASATVIVGEDASNPAVKQEDVTTSIRLTGTYAAAATRQPVLEAVVKTLGLKSDWHDLQDNVLAVSIGGTQLFEIRVTDSDPQRAAAIANEIAHQLIVQSPSAQNLQELADRRQFAKSQMDALQANIDSGEATLREEQTALDRETSARAVLDLRSEIQSLQTKLSDWRSAYSRLAASFPARGPNTLTVLESASPPTRPVGPNVVANVLLASAVALLLTMATTFGIEYVNSGRLLTAEDAAEPLSTVSLGAIPVLKGASGNRQRSAGLADPGSPAAEAYRVLRTNLLFAAGSRDSLCVLVSSPNPGEGKSTTSANLAASFAQTGKRTILVDGDLRDPSQHEAFGIPNTGGLVSLIQTGSLDAGIPKPDSDGALAGQVSDALVPATLPNLYILPAGSAGAANPGELLASAPAERVLVALRQSASVVIVDGPPVLPVADCAMLAAMGCAVLMVAEAGATRRSDMRAAGEMLAQAHARVLGVVLNRAPVSIARYYYPREEPAEAKRRKPSLRLLRDA